MRTDEQVLDHLPEAAALICAVRDRDHVTTGEILTRTSTADLMALCVLLAEMVPDDRRLTELLDHRCPRDSDGVPINRDDWTPEELRDAHRRWGHHRERTPWAQAGEREYQRRRKARSNALKRLDRQAMAVRREAAA